MQIAALILFGVFLNTCAQILLKLGMTQIGQFEFSLANTIPIGIKIVGNLPILTGLSFFVLSTGIWLMVLSRIQVSFAYPMLSIGYVLNAIAAYYLLGEPMTSVRLLGIFVIIAGVYLVAQSH